MYVVFHSTLLLMVNHLLGYYVIALILSVITALITIYHHQIVAKLTPAAHWMKTSVLICISSQIPPSPHSCSAPSDRDLLLC
jgi:energy-converting hydrogenase Eha subunit A